MKRLIKHNEWVQSYEINKDTIELFKNPSNSEIRDSRDSGYGDLRGLWYFDGTVYIWPGIYLHDRIWDIFTELDFEQPHLDIEGREYIRVHLDGYVFNYELIQQSMNINKVMLQLLVNIDTARIDINNKILLLKDFLEYGRDYIK